MADVLPSPNDQSHEVGEFVDSSINCTVMGTVPSVAVDTNAASGTDTAETCRTSKIQKISTKPILKNRIFIIFLLDHPVSLLQYG